MLLKGIEGSGDKVVARQMAATFASWAAFAAIDIEVATSVIFFVFSACRSALPFCLFRFDSAAATRRQKLPHVAAWQMAKRRWYFLGECVGWSGAWARGRGKQIWPAYQTHLTETSHGLRASMRSWGSSSCCSQRQAERAGWSRVPLGV